MNKRDQKRFNRLILWIVNHSRACLYGLGELIRTPLASIMTIAVIGVAMALPTGFYLFLQNFQTLSKPWNGKPTISLYLKLNTPDAKINQLITQLKNRSDISNIQYTSAENGLSELKKSMVLDDVINTLSSNPLPPVLTIIPTKNNPAALQQLLLNLKTLPLVDVAQLDFAWVERLHHLITLGQRITDTLAILLSVGVILIIGNTIRLTTDNYRQEITILKLVGATPSFIRRPLLYRGFFYGFLGGCVAWFLVSILLLETTSPASLLAATYNYHYVIHGLSIKTGVFIILISILMGLCGSWLAIYRHLNAVERL
ncbi:ABC transporter permease [Coxiella burnetii]|uniref:Cell division protein FtsX n=1 Tax=Coxiella burnetii (strain Dugway 5J108-111) TaxID=434922 RepID=A9KBU4_COXBN|nr:permease-like cell division protein FtsX [Coxiella burnetii]ABS76647.2 cell division protein [Coxiella burnetii Dugway 5J108-111]OYK81065.1 ABC transporter permease [Coxiella burnetii]OYK83154.1 ABC transporter permease [Coxiella burnetii]